MPRKPSGKATPRKFGGEHFVCMSWSHLKSHSQKQAEGMREKGYRVRVVAVKNGVGTPGYAVYSSLHPKKRK